MSEPSPSLPNNDVKKNCLFKDDDDDDETVVCLCSNCDRCDDDDYREETPTDSDLDFINDGVISIHTATSSSSDEEDDDDDSVKCVYVNRRRGRIITSDDEDDDSVKCVYVKRSRRRIITSDDEEDEEASTPKKILVDGTSSEK
ncbi:uncharacterized transmembrane protein DDB_G0283675-like [Ixodes scapularis]|uniref:uncharacterized transmembrane protein DDB_G0283675-like n=1 Tax=Ixodes scapularis TaxID=6945 RepID=UPI001A9EED72|nr:uncharacterized transmembrane protein DDB_G0283675-like [Ixodes scapularis]